MSVFSRKDIIKKKTTTRSETKYRMIQFKFPYLFVQEKETKEENSLTIAFFDLKDWPSIKGDGDTVFSQYKLKNRMSDESLIEIVDKVNEFLKAYKKEIIHNILG